MLEEVVEWQKRRLLAMYPLIFFDPLLIRIGGKGGVRIRAVYLALGITSSGSKDALGLWIEQTPGPEFWMQAMAEMKARGIQDVLVAVIDTFNGYPGAITTTFPL